MEPPVTRRTFLALTGSSVLAYSLGGFRAVAGEEDRSSRLRPFEVAGELEFSGVYPHLAFYNEHRECGVGAVVPWAGRLWVITYGPHFPHESTDKLYEIDSNLNRTVRPESVGGTHANRMVHVESNQLFIGPYAIGEDRNIRVIPRQEMPGRLTGTARHLTDPGHKIYFATMEEGFYEVDVHSLDVKTLNPDGNVTDSADISGELLPGSHGKGLYTGQGQLVYANNGEYSPEARKRPDVTSGCLAEWDGETWEVVRRNQFTEVTGPGGITGNEDSEEPLWSYGWDHRSAIFMLLDGGTWRSFRMPKASHTYDASHGWYTEWPRIRAISDDRLLMTMHGMFWDFPTHFSDQNTAGIRPLSTYLKIIGDFCEWNGKIVCGCDDASKVSNSAIPSQEAIVERSNSNLWFVDPDQFDDFGCALGRGGPWIEDSVEAEEFSDPFFFAGFDHRMVHISHDADQPVTFSFEGDEDGRGRWRPLTSVTVPASGYAYHLFDESIEAEWVRVKPDASVKKATLIYQFADQNQRPTKAAPLFRGLAKPGKPSSFGIVRSGDGNGRLEFAAQEITPQGEVRKLGYYEVSPDMEVLRINEPGKYRRMTNEFAPEDLPYIIDESSVVMTTDAGQRYRLPKPLPDMQQSPETVWTRAIREVVTERSLLNCQGHLYELPQASAGGFSKIRPVATSEFLITDLCSWRGLLVIAGLDSDMPENKHIVRSEDSQCGLWFGVVDDLWKLGKPRGEGGPWRNAQVRKGEPSDPYLMTGYDHKRLELSHTEQEPIPFTVEVELTGDDHWVTYQEFVVEPGQTMTHDFPDNFNAYWVRVKASKDTQATAQFYYS